jgi:hypothetical protein
MRKLLITGFLLISCGKSDVEVWYSLGEIHDYHFKRVINKVWKDFGFGIVLKSFSSQGEMDESLRVRQPDLALVYPQTLKNLIKSGKLMEFAEKEELPNYCGRYCYPMFKSVLGFYVNEELAKQVGFPTKFKVQDLLNLQSDYVVLGVYPSATFYTGLIFVFLSEGKDTLNACISSYEFLKGLSRKGYVRIYPNPRIAQNDMITYKIVSIVGTSAYKPYIEREGVRLKFVPLVNSKGEEVYFLSGPDFVVFKGADLRLAKRFINILGRAIEKDTLWENFGYIPLEKLKGLKHLYSDVNWDIDREKLREMSIRALNPKDSIPNDSIPLLCKEALNI